MSESGFRLERIADEFESAWQSGQCPDLIGFLDQVPTDQRAVLGRLLIPIDIEYRTRTGLPVEISAYQSLGEELVRFAARELAATGLDHGDQPASENGSAVPFPLAMHKAEAGDQIGPWTLVRLLGKGGMGEVWIANQFQPVRRQVALKLIRSDLGSRRIVSRFEAERRALALMDHPNIARILDAGATAQGQPYFVLELVEGLPLTEFCDANQLSIADRLRLFLDVCAGVQHAHQKGIIHRDLKPGNILVGLSGGLPTPKVIDFGLARAMDSPERLTDPSLFTGIGQVLGTLHYMSPEQTGLDWIDIDTRTDIYSLGVVLYELLTGDTPLGAIPIQGLAALQILKQIQESEPARPSRRLAACDAGRKLEITRARRTDSSRLNRIFAGDLDWIVMKALEKDRTRRYDTVSGLAADIRRFLENEPVSARPPSLAYRLRKFIRKNRALVGLGGTAIATLVTGLIGTGLALQWALGERLAARRAHEQLETKNAELTRQQEDLHEVIEFQATRILPIDPAALGARVRAMLIEQRRDFLVRQGKSGEEAEQLVTAFERELAPVNFSDLGLATLSEDFLGRLALAVDSAFAERPGIRLQLLESLAETAVDLGALQTALSLETTVIGLRRTISGEASEETLQAEATRGQILQMLGKLDDADQLLETTLQSCRSFLGTKHPATVQIAVHYARNLKQLSRFDEAEAVAREAIAWVDAVPSAGMRLQLRTRHMLGQILSELMKYDEAESLLDRNLEQARQALPSGDDDLIVAIGESGLLKQRMRKPDEAEALLRECFAMSEERYGRSHPRTLEAINNLGSFLTSWRAQSEALPILEESLERHREVLGEYHMRTLIAGQSVGVPYFFRKEFDKAISVFERVLPGLELELGPAHEATVVVRANLGINYRESGRLEDAMRLLEQAYTDRQLSHDHAFIPKELFYTCLRAEQVERAREIAREAIAGVNKRSPQPSRERLLGLWPPANWLWRAGLFEESETALRECLILREQFEAGDWKVFDNQAVLGNVLLELDRIEEAGVLLQSGYEGLAERAETIPEAFRKDHIPRALEGLIDFHTRRGEIARAVEYRAKRDTYLEQITR